MLMVVVAVLVSLVSFSLRPRRRDAQCIFVARHSIPFPLLAAASVCACARGGAGVTSLGCRICRGRECALAVWKRGRSRNHAHAIPQWPPRSPEERLVGRRRRMSAVARSSLPVAWTGCAVSQLGPLLRSLWT